MVKYTITTIEMVKYTSIEMVKYTTTIEMVKYTITTIEINTLSLL